jgi:hypothetical protein
MIQESRQADGHVVVLKFEPLRVACGKHAAVATPFPARGLYIREPRRKSLSNGSMAPWSDGTTVHCQLGRRFSGFIFIGPTVQWTKGDGAHGN